SLSYFFTYFFLFFPFFFFNHTPTTEIYTLSLHDALPIYCRNLARAKRRTQRSFNLRDRDAARCRFFAINLNINLRRVDLQITIRSEEHTSELQSRGHLVCRLLLEKKKE